MTRGEHKIPTGSYNSVARLEAMLREAGFTQDLFGQWRKEDAPVLIVEGSRVNGFYVAELRK